MVQRPPKFLRRLLLTAAPPLIALGAVRLTQTSLAGRLPDSLATHIGLSGRADRFASTAQFLFATTMMIGLLGAFFLVLVVVMRGNPHGQRFMVTGSFAVSTLLGLLHGVVLLSNLDVADATTVTFSGWGIAVPIVAAVLAGALGYALAGHVPAPERTGPLPEDAPRITLAAEERASWSQTMTTRLPLLGGGVLFVGVLTAAISVEWSVAIALLPALLLLITSSVRVTVDGAGLSVRLSLVGWPRKRIALSEIKVVHVKTIRPFKDFGGWGYRFNGAASGVVLRTGEALVVELTNGTEFVVTVDNAETGAALLNTLAERSRTLG
ncbi:hypothetical protein [Allokutzneria oryzae]|uniref:DUF1648 domain-containing protein n=1 Tax=Allokutzneria oryzae TaxID=1378989 RepID=A0ABV6AA05_9PSEU